MVGFGLELVIIEGLRREASQVELVGGFEQYTGDMGSAGMTDDSLRINR